jgi:hypothetical protein
MADNTRICQAGDIPVETVAKTVATQVDSLDPQRAAAFDRLQALRVVRARGDEREQKRLARKFGEDHPRVMVVAERARMNAGLRRDLALEQARAAVEAPAVDKDGYVFHGFVRNTAAQGVPEFTVALYDEKGEWVREMGFGCTDARGYFILRYRGAGKDAAGNAAVSSAAFVATAAAVGTGAAARTRVLVHVLDSAQKTLHVEREPLQPQLGEIDFRIIVLGAETRPCVPPPSSTPPATQPPPTQPPPTQPPPTQPPATEPPKTTPVRTPLDRLGIDDAMRKRLEEGGLPDVEAVASVDRTLLEKVVGDATTASRLQRKAQAIVAAAASPTETTPTTTGVSTVGRLSATATRASTSKARKTPKGGKT